MTLSSAQLTIERRHPEATRLTSVMDDTSFYHVPGALSLMEYHHPFNGNITPPLTNWEPSELILRSFNEIQRYDLHNLQQADCSPLVVSAAGHGGQGRSSTSPLFDMVAASQHLTVGRSNYRTCAPECSTGLPNSRWSCATACCKSAEDGESLFKPVNEFRFRDDSLFVETKLHSRGAAENRERSKVLSRLSGPSRPDERQPVQVDLDRKAAEVPESILTSNHKLLLGQLEESDQIVIDKILRDHFQNSSKDSEVEPGSYPHGIACLSSSTLRPSQRTFNEDKLGDQAQLKSTRMRMSSLETIVSPEPSGSGLPASQSTTLTSSHSKSAPSSSRPVDVDNNADHGRNCNGEPNLEGSWKPQKPSTPSYKLHLGPSGLSCARSSRNSTVRKLAMTANGIEQANVPKPKAKKKRSRVSSSGRESENQRLTHIAVERNRRKQMNSNLAALQALMPSSFIEKVQTCPYVEKPDQSSIIGGAVEFVKELEAILQFLQLKKRRHCQAYTKILNPSCSQFAHPGPSDRAAAPVSSISTATAARSPPIISPTSEELADYSASFQERFMMSSELFPALTQNSFKTAELKAESRSTAATVGVKVLGDNATVHIITRPRANQLVKLIVTLESLYLTILNTRITANKIMVLYTFNAQVGRECRMSVNQVAAALQHTFNLIQSMDDHLGHPQLPHN